MSRTARKDPIDIQPKRGDGAFMGIRFSSSPSPSEISKAHRDGKPWQKPGKRAKTYLSKGKKAKKRRQLNAVVNDPEAAPLPRERNTHEWDYL